MPFMPPIWWSHLQSTCAAAQGHSTARAQSVPLFSQAHCHRVCCTGQQASSGSSPWQASLAAGASAGDAHASMAGLGFRRQAAAAAVGLVLVLLSLEGGAAQTTPALNLTVAQPNGIANVSLVTATAPAHCQQRRRGQPEHRLQHSRQHRRAQHTVRAHKLTRRVPGGAALCGSATGSLVHAVAVHTVDSVGAHDHIVTFSTRQHRRAAASNACYLRFMSVGHLAVCQQALACLNRTSTGRHGCAAAMANPAAGTLAACTTRISATGPLLLWVATMSACPTRD